MADAGYDPQDAIANRFDTMNRAFLRGDLETLGESSILTNAMQARAAQGGIELELGNAPEDPEVFYTTVEGLFTSEGYSSERGLDADITSGHHFAKGSEHVHVTFTPLGDGTARCTINPAIYR